MSSSLVDECNVCWMGRLQQIVSVPPSTCSMPVSRHSTLTPLIESTPPVEDYRQSTLKLPPVDINSVEYRWWKLGCENFRSKSSTSPLTDLVSNSVPGLHPPDPERRRLLITYVGMSSEEELSKLEEEASGMAAFNGKMIRICRTSNETNPNKNRPSNMKLSSLHKSNLPNHECYRREMARRKRDRSRLCSAYEDATRNKNVRVPRGCLSVSRRSSRRVKQSLESNEYDDKTARWNDSRRLRLHRELTKACNAARDFDCSLKEDVLLIYQTFPSIIEIGNTSYPRIRSELHHIAAEAISSQCAMLSSKVQGNALKSWNRLFAWGIRREKMKRYQQSQSLLIIESSLDFFFITHKRIACQRWVVGKEKRRNSERHAHASLIQCIWRKTIASQMMKKLRADRRSRAVSTLQRVWKGTSARLVFKMILHNRAELRAAIVLQSTVRRCRARSILRLYKLERKQYKCATDVQRAARGMIERRAARALRQDQVCLAAISNIQRACRGYIGRRISNERKKRLVRRSTYASFLQRNIRRHLGAGLATRLKEERKRHRQEMERVTVLVQRVYRGHRGRQAMRKSVEAHVLEARKRHKAAACIQALLRRDAAIFLTKTLRREALAVMVSNARNWVERWNEETNMLNYHHTKTNECLPKSPAVGYTRADTQLVLENGRMLFDPRLTLAVANCNEESTQCIECDEFQAFIFCHQCEEVFCNECFQRLHLHGGNHMPCHDYSPFSDLIESASSMLR